MSGGFPLEGIRVVDLSNYIAGPCASMYLADFGAEVIKCERGPHGDEHRSWGHRKNGIGIHFQMLNRNKKSVTVDLHTTFGVETVKRLVRDADVVIENYRPGTLEKWGLGYDVLSEIKPDVILLRMTGYGQEGPYKNKPGFGTALEAYCGAVYINGYPDRPPVLPGFGIADMSSGMAGAFLVMVALRERDARSGRGQVIDLALYESLFTMLAPIVSDYDQLGIVQERNGSRFTWVTPRNVYRTRDDKFVAISGGSQAVFQRLCNALSIPEVGNDPRFADTPSRSKNADVLDEILAQTVAGFDRDDLVARIEAAQAVVAPIRSIAEIVDDPQIVARESIVTVEDETLGPLKMQNVVGRLSRTPGKVRFSAPKCGRDNAEILIERLGFTPEELDRAGVPYESHAR